VTRVILSGSASIENCKEYCPSIGFQDEGFVSPDASILACDRLNVIVLGFQGFEGGTLRVEAGGGVGWIEVEAIPGSSNRGTPLVEGYLVILEGVAMN